MAVVVKGSKGQDVYLLNPSEKGAKFARELKEKKHRFNSGAFKLENKKSIPLKPTEAAYRMGYLAAQKDNAKAYKHNQKKKKRR